MSNYTVTWEIEISADSPLEAAKEARSAQQDPFSEALTYEVHKGGEFITYVSLMDE